MKRPLCPQLLPHSLFLNPWRVPSRGKGEALGYQRGTGFYITLKDAFRKVKLCSYANVKKKENESLIHMIINHMNIILS